MATILLAVLPSLAQAAPVGIVTVGNVADFRAPAPTVDLWSQALSNLRIGGTPEHRATAVANVRAEIANGWRAYLQLDADAAKRLIAARDAAIALASDADGRAVLAEASLRLGVATSSIDAASARDALRLALTLSPNRSLDEREFSPDVLTLIAAIRGEVRPLVAVDVEVVAVTLSSVTVVVDGVAARQAEGARWTASLEAGDHLVAVATTLATPRMALIHVDGAHRQFALAAPVAQLTPSLRVGDDVETERRVLTDGMTVAGIDEVIVVARDSASHAWLAQWCLHTQPLMCTSIVEASDVATLWHELERAPRTSPPTLAEDPRLQAPTVALLPIARSTHTWRWVGTGAAVVAVVVGAVAWSLSSSASTSPTISIDGSRFTR